MPRHNRRGSRKGRDDGRWGSPRKRPEEADERADRSAFGRVIFPLQSFGGAAAASAAEPEPMVRACKDCREWSPDEVGGRGLCWHPGSGFLKPWSDTPACPFFAARRADAWPR